MTIVILYFLNYWNYKIIHKNIKSFQTKIGGVGVIFVNVGVNSSYDIKMTPTHIFAFHMDASIVLTSR